ncbi:hypothetical protein FORC066_1840 [Yersinia enterocolitica]|nr:hypothetical protein FORC066_1840 [Yersinia enterocolitica]
MFATQVNAFLTFVYSANSVTLKANQGAVTCHNNMKKIFD